MAQVLQQKELRAALRTASNDHVSARYRLGLEKLIACRHEAIVAQPRAADSKIKIGWGAHFVRHRCVGVLSVGFGVRVSFLKELAWCGL